MATADCAKTIHKKASKTGRKPYDPKYLLKLYIYGYFNEIRSSRKLEKECKRNIELMWLLDRLVPDDKTISDFRKDNKKAVIKVFKQFSRLCDELSLYEKEVIAVEELGLKKDKNKDLEKNSKEDIITVLAERGYYCGEELEKCKKDHINIIVPKQKSSSKTGNEKYIKDNFIYNEEEDTYTCPDGKILKNVKAESYMHFFTYNLIRVINIIGIKELIEILRDKKPLLIDIFCRYINFGIICMQIC